MSLKNGVQCGKLKKNIGDTLVCAIYIPLFGVASFCQNVLVHKYLSSFSVIGYRIHPFGGSDVKIRAIFVQPVYIFIIIIDVVNMFCIFYTCVFLIPL